MHVDFTRVAADEKIEVQVTIELRGVAPGVSEGGVVEHLVHRLDIECLAVSIPPKFVLNINSLKLDESLTASDIELPEGVRLVSKAETIIVQCIERAEEEGFSPTGERYPAGYRNNDRLVIDDAELAETLFERLRSQLPESLERDGERWVLVDLANLLAVQQDGSEKILMTVVRRSPGRQAK